MKVLQVNADIDNSGKYKCSNLEKLETYSPYLNASGKLTIVYLTDNFLKLFDRFLRLDILNSKINFNRLWRFKSKF